MSVSTDAVIFYGYVWEDESEDSDALARLLDIDDKSMGVMVDTHCHRDNPMLYICASDSHRVAWRGRPVHLNGEFVRMLGDVATQDRWRGDLKQFCDQYDVDLSEATGPDWYLVSDTDF